MATKGLIIIFKEKLKGVWLIDVAWYTEIHGFRLVSSEGIATVTWLAVRKASYVPVFHIAAFLPRISNQSLLNLPLAQNSP